MTHAYILFGMREKMVFLEPCVSPVLTQNQGFWNFHDPLTLILLSPFGSLKYYDYLSIPFILKLSYSKPFQNTLNYASTANIEEVMKFYNLGDKIFETDFNLISENYVLICYCV